MKNIKTAKEFIKDKHDEQKVFDKYEVALLMIDYAEYVLNIYKFIFVEDEDHE